MKFHVRARTVDLLGRQQIAGIPTAVSELFKNAHDAYAKTAEVDYYRDDGLLVIRDDGLGMTHTEFEERWLTLGTDSKLSEKGALTSPRRDTRQKKRPILGEKGIGRLAIAIIGPQVLVLTRARRSAAPNDEITAAYINWAMFELPGVDLDDIEIPVCTFAAGDLPDASDIQALVDRSTSWLTALSHKIGRLQLERIREQVSCFNVNPRDIDSYLGEPSLAGDGCGTHFFIRPADPILQDDIDSREGDKASRIEKHLLGFTNTMTPNFSPPPIVARFRDHRDEGSAIELIGDKAFFTPEEFLEVDHHISGTFDKFGQFRGGVGIYQMEPDPHVINWHETDGNETLCGPFSFAFAVLQGLAKDSLLPADEHTHLISKLNRIGGLYVYRDGVRVQPYGDSDYDWLDIERRRTLSASYYYFSYRRMFGAIELSREHNAALVEKAGREGFSENKAYRQFRSILVNFFVQIAADFFREDGKYAEDWQEKRSELNRNEQIRRRKAKQSTGRKLEFEKELDGFFAAIEAGTPETETAKALKHLERSVTQVLKQNTKPAQKAAAFMRLEKEGRDLLRKQRLALTVSRPRGVGLSKKLSNEWVAYQSELDRLEKHVLSPTEARMEEIVSQVADEAKAPVNQLTRVSVAVTENADEARKVTARLKKDNEAALAEFTQKARETIRSSSRAVSKVVDDVLAELQHLKNVAQEIRDVSEKREELDSRIENVFLVEKERLEKLRVQFAAMEDFWREDGYGSVDLTEALEEELEALRDQRDGSLELAQVGLVINTVTHEFEKTVRGLRDGFRRLSSWANANPKLSELYSEMRSSFDHLDNYLSMFTPLDRRLHRSQVDISGNEIYSFLYSLFEGRLKRHDIELTSTPEFRKAVVRGYPSTFYPVFVNLVDNAIYWLQSVANRKRRISLDWNSDNLLVHDNGPGVSPRDFENIFRLNFSRKPGGRGMGLYISRTALKRVGYTITIDTENRGEGTTFVIAPGHAGD